jgi:hypothetical protein
MPQLSNRGELAGQSPHVFLFPARRDAMLAAANHKPSGTATAN